MDENERYNDWCAAVDLDPEADSTRDAYSDALVAEYEQQAMNADLDAERFAMEFSAVEQGYYDDDPNPYAGDYSEM